MPMWVYYANNHSGFCVEYVIDRKLKKFMYPVSYDDTRVPGNSIVGNIINQTFDLIKEGNGEDDMSGELNALNHIAYLSLTSKHKSWKHEKEIRALVPRFYGDYLDILPKKIQPYYEVFQMKNVANSLKHWLAEEKINIDN